MPLEYFGEEFSGTAPNFLIEQYIYISDEVSLMFL